MSEREFAADISKIRNYLTEPELLAQLAEELVEWAQAALKLRRVLDGTNPTPKMWPEVWDNFLEEWSDVATVLEVLQYYSAAATVIRQATRKRKLSRWASRLEERK